jgi:hypothetical protein
MAAERRVTAARLADNHAAARTDAHHRNIKAARAAMAAAEQRLSRRAEEGDWRRSASVMKTSTPLLCLTTALGRPTLHRHRHRAHREPMPPAGTPIKTSSYSFIYILPYYIKIIYISMKSIYFNEFS